MVKQHQEIQTTLRTAPLTNLKIEPGRIIYLRVCNTKIKSKEKSMVYIMHTWIKMNAVFKHKKGRKLEHWNHKFALVNFNLRDIYLEVVKWDL